MQGELLKGMQFRKPDISFDGDYVLDLGGVPVRMTSVGATAHGGRNTVFLVEGDRVLWSGDVVMSAFPAVNPRFNDNRGERWTNRAHWRPHNCRQRLPLARSFCAQWLFGRRLTCERRPGRGRAHALQIDMTDSTSECAGYYTTEGVRNSSAATVHCGIPERRRLKTSH